MSLRTTLYLIILFLGIYGKAQVSDDFSDGNFSEAPIWYGETSFFQITNGALNSAGPDASSEIYLSTPTTLADYTVWEFFLQIDGSAPSGSNQVKIYLMSTQAILTGVSDGYYLEVGQTGDDYLNLKKTDGSVLLTGTTPFDDQVRVKVTRSPEGEWQLWADHSGGYQYLFEGATTDLTHTTTAAFGWVVKHTKTRKESFFLDDVQVDQLRVDSVSVISSTQLDIQFNQFVTRDDAENTANYAIQGLVINSAQRDADDSARVFLTLDGSTPLSTSTYSLVLKNAFTRQSADTINFQYRELTLDTILTLSDSELLLEFNDTVRTAEAENVATYTVDQGIGTPSTAVRVAENPKQVKLELAGALAEGVNYKLTISGLQNAEGNSTFSGAKDFQFVIPLVLDTLSAKSENTLLVSFNKTLNASLAEAEDNYKLDAAETPLSAELQPDGKSVLLMFSEFENGDHTLAVNNLQDLEGNTLQENSEGTFSYLHLALRQIAYAGENKINAYFNQGVDTVAAGELTNYELSEAGQPIAATVSDSSVMLEWERLYNTDYTLAIEGVINALANSQPDSLGAWVAVRTASDYRSMLITEIMADPTPVVGLPDAEYVELYNPNSHSVNVGGFTLNDKVLDSFVVAANAYLLLTDREDSAGFGLTNSLGVMAFDALTNGGETIRLKDQFGITLDTVSYTDDWYGNSEKSNGGYALELIDPLQPCSGVQNWTASIHSSGGTPGAQNSVHDDDHQGPQIIDVDVLGADTLRIYFDEPVASASIQLADFELEEYSIAELDSLDMSTYQLRLSEELTSGAYYSLMVGAVQDCRGNSLSSQTYTFFHDIDGPQLLETFPIAANEVALLFDEPLEATSAEEEANYSLAAIAIDQATLQDSARHRVHLLLHTDLSEQSYELFVTGLEDTLGNVGDAARMEFSFEEAIADWRVVSANILSFSFTQAIDTSRISQSNFQLADGSHPESIANTDDRSVILGFETNFTANKSQRLYMKGIRSQAGNSMLTPALDFVYDTRSPDLDSMVVASDTTLLLYWDEPLDTLRALTTTLYELEGVSPIRVKSIDQKTFQLWFENQFEQEKDLRLTIKSQEDLSGNASSTKRTDFVYDKIPPSIARIDFQGSDELLIVFHEQITRTSSLALSHYQLGNDHPVAAKILGPDSTSVLLTFSAVAYDTALSFSATDISDVAGNLSENIQYRVDSYTPQITSIAAVSDRELSVDFSHALESGYAPLLHCDRSVDSVVEVSSYQASVYLSLPLSQGEHVIISASGVEAVHGATLDDSLSFVFETYFETYQLLDEQTLVLQFQTAFDSASRSHFQVESHDLAFVQLDGENSSLIQLSFANSLPENTPIEIVWTDLMDRFGRRLPDGAVTMQRDTHPPVVQEVGSAHGDKLQVSFDEALEASSALAKNHYAVDGTLPIEVALANDQKVDLTFPNGSFEVGKAYELIVDRVADLKGNYLLQDTTSFVYEPPTLPTPGGMLFTEIMADPSPAVGLPEAEYLELYNADTISFDLSVLKLSDELDTLKLPSYSLGAGEYVLLIDESNQAAYNSGNVLGLANMPSLANDGETLRLSTIFDEVVDEVAYSSSWYGEASKANGGYSLERNAMNNACPVAYNWAASKSEAGGTPGYQNSIFREGPDEEKPQLNSWSVVNGSVELVFSEPMDSASLLQASVDFALPVERRTVDDGAERLTLHLADQFSPGEAYTLSISGPLDCTGNALDSIGLELSVGKSPASGELIITEIMADPEPPNGLPGVEYVEVYNASSYYLDLEDVEFADERDTVGLPAYTLPPERYVALASEAGAQQLIEFGSALGVRGFPALTNAGEQLTLFSAGAKIDEVIYSADWYASEAQEGGHSLELINPAGTCKGAANWTSSTDALGGTPGTQNSVFHIGPDATAPEVVSFEVLDASTLRFVFSESMDSLSLLSSRLDGVVVDQFEVLGYYADTLVAHLFVPVARGEQVSITLSGPQDCSGNGMELNSFTVGLGDRPAFGELVITEIMADPEPLVGLPPSEYVEVLNTSDRLLSLGGLQLVVETDTVLLPAATVEPGAYVLLVPKAAVGLFEGGAVVGLSGWAAIKNSGDFLAIIGEELIHQVEFDQEWYGEEKADGGFSLEIKDPLNVCAGAINWTASTHPNGGTPAFANAVSEAVPDNFGPEVLAARVVTANELHVLFSEPLAVNSVINLVVDLSPDVSVARLELNKYRTQLTLFLEDSLQRNLPYEVRIFGLRDCLGNTNEPLEFTLIRPGVATEGQVRLSELLFNPKPEGVDFIELYNTGDSYVDLYGWDLERLLDDGTEMTTITTHYLLGPHAYVALTEDTISLKNQYPPRVSKRLLQTQLPAMPNEAGHIHIVSGAGIRQDAFEYDEDFHLTLLDDVDGVSLERLDFENPTQDANNWTSASSAVGFATPGYANSQARGQQVASGKLAVTPKVFIPASSNPAFPSFATISYQLSQPGQFANITIYNQAGQVTYQLAQGISLSQEGFVRWDGTDDAGRKAPMGYYVVLFELYDSNGNQQYLKETVVVGH
ncbi:lamin tail domain-containing protein [Marinoscillum furvescens]|uniref:Lamin tail-like protein n=1 Tax=Marinoscillum furvescens DSM 4134 TaxID=1122208 RepID=A0A3D9L4G6_MARFU|nr:lamin tail domain-containing protein [Marinoscillum furvescens]REE00515.1 lamin tail-like protein [Marinoscillum furvescens DSM 4134]